MKESKGQFESIASHIIIEVNVNATLTDFEGMSVC